VADTVAADGTFSTACAPGARITPARRQLKTVPALNARRMGDSLFFRYIDTSFLISTDMQAYRDDTDMACAYPAAFITGQAPFINLIAGLYRISSAIMPFSLM
jgi:hypothetical protein